MQNFVKPGVRWTTVIVTVFMLLAVSFGILFVSKRQDIRNRAALTGSALSMNPATISKPAGSTTTVGIILNSGPDSVSAAQLQLVYDPALLTITAFEPGKPLPVVLSPVSITPGKVDVTLGAQPNAPLKGSDIIGTLTVKILTDKPASINFNQPAANQGTAIAALEKTTNTLVSASGVSFNGAITTPIANSCSGSDGSFCTIGTCPAGATCKLQSGVCKAGVCTPTVTSCNSSNNGSTCTTCEPCPEGRICPAVCKSITGTCKDSICVSTPPSGCYYKNVQCVQAPCNPVLVCPSISPNPTCIPLPECVYNPPIVNGKPVLCSIPPPPSGNTYCPRPTPTPTPTTHNWCPGPNGAQCNWDCNTCNATGGCTKMKCPAVIGTCQNNICVKPSTSPTPTPFTQTGCVRSGCSGQICGSSAVGGGFTTCEYKPIYACYQQGRCEKQANGLCGWTATTELQSCLAQYVSPTATPTGTSNQTIEIKVKLSGVTDNSADGARISVKFIKIGGETLQLSSTLPLSHIGNGVYKATATLTNPLVAGERYRVKVKGEKHVAVEYCKSSGQSGPCADGDYMNGSAGTSLFYDFTSLPLPPGDVAPQDGKVDVTDFNTIKSLMSKLCSDLSAQDKLKGDLDYNGCVTVKDIFLIRQTLETRYDE